MTPQAHDVRSGDPEVGNVPAYYPSQGYFLGGVEVKGRSSVPWWTNPESYPEPRYYDGPDWTGNTRFGGFYVSDPRIQGNGRVPRRTWNDTAPLDKSDDSADWYRYKRGQTEIPLDRLKSPDVVDDLDEAKKKKKRKEWPLWRRVAVQNVDELTPKVMDGGFIQNYGYIK